MKIKQTTFMANVTNVGIGDLTKNEGKTIMLYGTLAFDKLDIIILKLTYFVVFLYQSCVTEIFSHSIKSI